MLSPIEPTRAARLLVLAARRAGTLHALDCGTGAGGFKPGNTCAKGDAAAAVFQEMPGDFTLEDAQYDVNTKYPRELMVVAQVDLSLLSSEYGNDARVREMTAAMKSGDKFPPLTLELREDGTLRISDGRTRVAALRELGVTVGKVPAVVRLPDFDTEGLLPKGVAIDKKRTASLRQEKIHALGGPGSGNFGHAGRPGEVGGSSSGASVSQAAELYTGHGIDGKKISAVSEAILSGKDVDDRALDAGANDEHIEAARVLVSRIRSASETEKVLYRGLSSEIALTDIEALKPGDTVTLPRISSFTESRGYAAMYADLGGHRHKYEFRLEGPSKTLATDALTLQKTHREHITQGKFEVVSVLEGGKVRWSSGGSLVEQGGNAVQYQRILVLRQKGIF